MRMKDRNKFPPRGWTLLMPEIGMQRPISGSFNAVVDAFSDIVLKNPALAQKHGWPTDRIGQENWVDERECHRMLAHGWTRFVELEGTLPPPGPPPLGGMRHGSQGGVAVAASKAMTGAAIWKDMFSNGKPVAKELAEERASICAGCPENKRGGFKEWFTETLARGLNELVGLMNSQQLTTSKDDELGTCAACLCPMKCKVWVPLEIIKSHMPPADIAKLDRRCWIL